ncbi:hypothetical protein ACFYQA_12025 [Streptomyces sp. NPDC005774]|uniref:hypothetical protein n=1 Tax=Streptomyces sp. NPDC005774 TaxID=3364728 RepID=UPI0036CB2065
MATPITALEQRVADLQKQAAGPTTELEQVRAELETAREAEAARQATRGEDWERGLLNGWEEMDVQLQAEEKQHRADFLAALQNDPVWAAWTRMRATWHRRNAIRSTADGARYRGAVREGRPTQEGAVIPLLNYREPTILWDTIIKAIEDQGQDAADAETARLQAERDAYVKGTD